MKKYIQLSFACLSLTVVALLAGCASTPITPEQIAQGDYGAPPSDHEAYLKSYFEGVLKDPYSAVYRFGKPYKGYLTKAPIAGGGIDQFGWLVEVDVNAKNSYGGYTGMKPYMFFYKNGTWKDVSYIRMLRG
jgi:hypothetical protein